MKELASADKSGDEKGQSKSWNSILSLKFLVVAAYFVYGIITLWQALLRLNTFGWAKDEVSALTRNLSLWF